MTPSRRKTNVGYQAKSFFMMAVLCIMYTAYTQPNFFHSRRKMQAKQISRKLSKENEDLRIEIFKRVTMSVVNIDVFGKGLDSTQTSKRYLQGLGLGGKLFAEMLSGENSLIGSGSGFVWDAEGHVITNNHVIEGSEEAQVLLLTPSNAPEADAGSSTLLSSKSGSDPSVPGYQWKVCKAKLVARDPLTDIAILKVEAPAEVFHPIEKGTSNALQVGQDVLAIGNPYGMDHTLTQGIISARRAFATPTGGIIVDAIQTDAAINPGSSGGPLLDREGKLIGMNTGIISETGTSSGIGLSIPVDTLNHIADLLIKNGKIVRPSMGLMYSTKLQEEFFGVAEGVLVMGIEKDGPADKEGLKGTHFTSNGLMKLEYEIGDIIIGIDRHKIRTAIDLFETLEKYAPGQAINVKVIRNEGKNRRW